MTIRRVRSRIRPTAAAAHLSAVAHRILPLTVLCAFPWVLLGAQLAAPAAAQSKDQEVYPKAPPGPPPVTKVEGADAKDEADMKAYEEGITGTDATFKLIPIPGGEFLMGSPADEEGRSDFEGPQVKVRVSPFWMGTHEVAWKEYSQYMDSLDMRARNLA